MKAKFVYEAMDDVLKGKSEEEIMSSLEKSSDLDLNDLLINAAAAGFLPGVKKALERGADVHYGENSALRRASLYGHYDVVEFLLKNGADVHVSENASLENASNYTDVVELIKRYM